MIANLTVVKISGEINCHAGFDLAGMQPGEPPGFVWSRATARGALILPLGASRPRPHMLLGAFISWHTIAGEGIL
jgi:hypothetical protein